MAMWAGKLALRAAQIIYSIQYLIWCYQQGNMQGRQLPSYYTA